MRPGCEFQSHGANEGPNRVIHTENEMILQILSIQQRPKLLLLLFGIALLVHANIEASSNKEIDRLQAIINDKIE
jgi:hypothetical protein